MVGSVVFDMDGVLFDTEKIYTAALRRVGKIMDIPDIEDAVTKTVGLNSVDNRKYFFAKYGEDFPHTEFLRHTGEIFHEIIDRDGVPVKPGAVEILEYLKSIGCKIGLATSTGRTSTINHLTLAGIVDYFQVIVTGDMIIEGKPNPEIYLTVCSQLGVSPEDTFAIEDSFNGVRAALNAGMKTIMVPDLVQPTEDLESQLYKKFDSLLDVKFFFQTL